MSAPEERSPGLLDGARLADSLVAEVASNDGYLLQYFKQRGVPVLGIEPARNVAEELQNAELVIFPEVGHSPHLDNPDEYHGELIRFLRSDPDEPADQAWRDGPEVPQG